MMRSTNPAMTRGFGSNMRTMTGDGVMTVNGTINKTGFLVLLAIATAAWAWSNTVHINELGETIVSPPAYLWALMIGGFITAIVLIFKQTWAPVLAPAYALCQGVIIGVLSAMFEVQYPGIVVQASMGTFGTLFGMLFLYRTGVIKVTDRFRSIVIMATFGIALVYLVGFVMSFFGAQIPGIHGSGTIGIGFSVLVCGIAAMNLLLDFDFIEKASQQGAPQYMEWYGGFALLVTLIWLYMEILRLLSKMNKR